MFKAPVLSRYCLISLIPTWHLGIQIGLYITQDKEHMQPLIPVLEVRWGCTEAGSGSPGRESYTWWDKCSNAVKVIYAGLQVLVLCVLPHLSKYVSSRSWKISHWNDEVVKLCCVWALILPLLLYWISDIKTILRIICICSKFKNHVIAI